VRGALVEDVARAVITLTGEQRVESAADVAVKAAEELAEVGLGEGDARVVMGDHPHAVMGGDLRLPRRVGEGIEPGLLDAWIPRREERLAERRPTRDGQRGPADHDARGGHGERPGQGPCRISRHVIPRTYAPKTAEVAADRRRPPVRGPDGARQQPDRRRGASQTYCGASQTFVHLG